MALSVNFKKAKLSSMALAKVGNPLRKEALQTSKTLCQFEPGDAELLTHCFLKPFRSLELHRFHHHNGVEKNEVFGYAESIFSEPESLIENGKRIAGLLYDKSHHPNIKSGDLCIAVLEDCVVEKQTVRAISIVKSESKVPFLQVSVADGDLKLTTQQGIYPDKIDKGCLIVDCRKDEGYAVYTFDKSGATPYFWNRDFLGIIPVCDDDYLTKRYTELCVAFAKDGLPEEVRSEERDQIANRTIGYINDAEQFNIKEFEEVALKEPEVIEQFSEFKTEYEEETGQELVEEFPVAKGVAEKAKKKLKGSLKLDTGADILFSSTFLDSADSLIEHGFDEAKGMKFVKLFYNEEG